MNGHMDDLTDRLEAFRESDRERDALVTDLIKKYADLQEKYREKCDDYDDAVESRRTHQRNAGDAARELQSLRQTSGSNPFVLVMLDGDGAIFDDYLYSQGRDGGTEAAAQLQLEIRNQLKALYPDSATGDWQILVNVVLNVHGLGTKLASCGIFNNATDLQAFGRAFGLAQPLFNFIDVGSGKERADHKIRETLRLFMPMPQCKHVFFGPCSDNGYLPVLTPYKRDSLVSSRITLIETRSAEPGFVDLGFRMVRFPTIFRETNLPDYRVRPAASIATPAPPTTLPMRSASNMQVAAQSFVPQQQAAPGAPTAQPRRSPAPSTDSAASSTWAKVGKPGADSKTIDIAPKKKTQRPFLYLNVDDERIDTAIPKPDHMALKRFDARVKDVGKCCNDYYLLGKCALGEEYCDYIHNEKLTPSELLVLKHKARSRSCPMRHSCREISCTYGHNCNRGKACLMDQCWFADTHSMDMEPAKKVYEDGSDEWIQSYLDKFHKG
nr:hypothetical protein B0A51_10110 [Rachicladosporium sp. CCFEE 5018]OQO25470.1 hypothetical protein B0A51_07339 [Rachicladosporium sp. CCFEE 5018]